MNGKMWPVISPSQGLPTVNKCHLHFLQPLVKHKGEIGQDESGLHPLPTVCQEGVIQGAEFILVPLLFQIMFFFFP